MGSILPTWIRNILWIDEVESHKLDHHIMVTNTKKDCRLLYLNLSHLHNARYMLRKAKRTRAEAKDRAQLHDLVTVYFAHCTMVATGHEDNLPFILLKLFSILCMLRKANGFKGGREIDLSSTDWKHFTLTTILW